MVLRGPKMADMSSPSRQITVVDVYDLASAIGKDFEKLIDLFGTGCIAELMPKVSEGCLLCLQLCQSQLLK